MVKNDTEFKKLRKFREKLANLSKTEIKIVKLRINGTKFANFRKKGAKNAKLFKN